MRRPTLLSRVINTIKRLFEMWTKKGKTIRPRVEWLRTYCARQLKVTRAGEPVEKIGRNTVLRALAVLYGTFVERKRRYMRSSVYTVVEPRQMSFGFCDVLEFQKSAPEQTELGTESIENPLAKIINTNFQEKPLSTVERVGKDGNGRVLRMVSQKTERKQMDPKNLPVGFNELTKILIGMAYAAGMKIGPKEPGYTQAASSAIPPEQHQAVIDCYYAMIRERKARFVPRPSNYLRDQEWLAVSGPRLIPYVDPKQKEREEQGVRIEDELRRRSRARRIS